ncbi:MAG: phosphodiester glycosidase family protein [Desulfitobacteriaceae bacterium]
MKKRQRISLKRVTAFVVYNTILAIVLAPFILFWGPFDALKTFAVGSVITSRHPGVVRAFLSDEKINEIIHKFDASNTGTGQDISSQKAVSDPSAGIEIEDIKGRTFKGKVMLIKDPKRVKVAVTRQLGESGERVSDFVQDTGAIAAINGGGFYDPNGKGNGAYPDGITMHNGEIVHNNVGNKATDMVALDKDGKLVIGKMTAEDLKKKNVLEAVSFWPSLVVNGKRGDFSDGEWGIAPRSAIGQKADGTIIFVVIDGRQPTWSVGAWMSDLYRIFMDYGAVNAVNLDGGSSSELVYNGKVINKLWNIFGERYIPTAFVAIPK